MFDVWLECLPPQALFGQAEVLSNRLEQRLLRSMNDCAWEQPHPDGCVHWSRVWRHSIRRSIGSRATLLWRSPQHALHPRRSFSLGLGFLLRSGLRMCGSSTHWTMAILCEESLHKQSVFRMAASSNEISIHVDHHIICGDINSGIRSPEEHMA